MKCKKQAVRKFSDCVRILHTEIKEVGEYKYL